MRDDFALVGFGDNILSSYLNPPLTTVKQSPYDMGKISCEIALEQIQNPAGTLAAETRVIKPQLIIRKSSRFLK